MSDLNAMGIFVGSFIAIIVGVIFVGVVADTIFLNTNLEDKVNESITITNTLNTITNESITLSSGIGTTGNSSVYRLTFFGNDTNNTDLASVALGTEVNVSVDGVIVVDTVQLEGDGPYNVSYVYAVDGTGSTSEDSLTSLSSFTNVTIGNEITGIELGDEINFTKGGTITVSTYNFTAGSYNISYGFQPDLYVQNGTARTLLKLIPLFFVLAIMAIGFLMVRKSFPDVFGS